MYNQNSEHQSQNKRTEIDSWREYEKDQCYQKESVKAELVDLVGPFRHENECHFFKNQICTSWGVVFSAFVFLFALNAQPWISQDSFQDIAKT